MGMAAVEGRVFAWNVWRPGGPAVAANFEMTDTAARCRAEIHGREGGRGLGGAVSDGMWLRVQGKLTLTFDGKDVQLQPVSIQRIQHQGRQDTAPEKRVELHLHTQMSTMDALTDVGRW